MTLRQNDWTLGAFCARYCGFVGQHHGIEDAAVFPHLAQREPQLAPIINRLIEEHQVIHVAIEEVDQALTDHIAHPEDYQRIQDAIDYLSDSLTSHLAYEEQELLEPLARHGFYPNQIATD
jgi:hemerythrin-like domain-containing protein